MTSAPDNTPENAVDDREATLYSTHGHAHQRLGDSTGYDAVGVFIDFSDLPRFIPTYEHSVFATSAECLNSATKCLDPPESRLELIMGVLREAADSDDPDASGLASRILVRMADSFRDSDNVSLIRPNLYVSPGKTGIAVVLAINEGFWSGQW
jgi:hypothetical protein